MTDGYMPDDCKECPKHGPYFGSGGCDKCPSRGRPPKKKLYGLDDIPEGWTIFALHKMVGENRHYAQLSGPKEQAIVYAKTPQLALHKAIQKARGEM